MDLFTVIIMIVMGIGALVLGAIGLVILFFYWWLVIPVVCTWLAGGFGLVFGIGLVAIIGLIKYCIEENS